MALVDSEDIEKALVEDAESTIQEEGGGSGDSEAPRRRRRRQKRRRDSSLTYEFWTGAVLCVPQLTFGTMYWGRCQPIPGKYS